MSTSDFESQLALILNLASTGRTEQARSQFVKLAQEYPSPVFTGFIEAQLLYFENRPTEALSTLKKALVWKPENPEFRTLQFRLLDELGRYEEAEEVVLPLLRETPENTELMSVYAAMLLKSGFAEKAELYAQHALTINPEEKLALVTAVVVAWVKGRLDLDSNRVQSLLREHPDCAHVLSMYAAFLVEKGQTQQALALAQQALRLDPGNRDYIDAVISYKVWSHPTLFLERLIPDGFLRTSLLWVFGIAIICVLALLSQDGLMMPFATLYVGYCIHTWITPWLLKRWYSYRGVSTTETQF